MTWLNPWAFAGTILLALPILIHLLGRGRANLHQFPTLRFVERSRLLPSRRTRIHNPLLLLLRLVILALGIAALALPRWNTANRTHKFNALRARAVILDTSASMHRLTVNGQSAAAVAEAAVNTLPAGPATVLLRTASIRSAVAGAVAWLTAQPGQAELMIVSDFQSGAVDSLAMAAVPASIGITMVPIAVTEIGPESRMAVLGDWQITSTAAAQPQEVLVAWRRSIAPKLLPLLALSRHEESTQLAASLRAAATIPLLLPVDSAEHVTVVFGDGPDRQSRLARASLPDQAWMLALLNRLDQDPLLASEGPMKGRSGDTLPGSVLPLSVARLGHGSLGAAAIADQGTTQLVLFSEAPPGSLAAATLLAAVNRARSHAPPPAEMATERAESTTVVRMNRPATAGVLPLAATAVDQETDGRWLWLAALAVLSVEALVRRKRTPAAGTSAAN